MHKKSNMLLKMSAIKDKTKNFQPLSKNIEINSIELLSVLKDFILIML